MWLRPGFPGVLEEQGCLVTSLDGSEEMCKLAEIYLTGPVLHMLYEEMEFDQVFDGIWHANRWFI